MKKLFRWLNAPLVFVLLVFSIVSLESFKTYFFDREINAQANTAFEDLQNKDTRMEASTKESWQLKILPLDYTLPLGWAQKMLDVNKGRFRVYTYFQKEAGVYTMSAPTQDGSHFLVNSYLVGYKPFHVDNVMLPLYTISKRKRYQLDEKQYAGNLEVWQSSKEAYKRLNGDCEDHALLLADWLIALGYDARVTIGTMDGEGHAWVTLFKNGKAFLLESTKKSIRRSIKAYPLASLFRQYRPTFMFNREFFWAKNTHHLTTENYSKNNWRKVSQYSAIN